MCDQSLNVMRCDTESQSVLNEKLRIKHIFMSSLTGLYVLMLYSVLLCETVRWGVYSTVYDRLPVDLARAEGLERVRLHRLLPVLRVNNVLFQRRSVR